MNLFQIIQRSAGLPLEAVGRRRARSFIEQSLHARRVQHQRLIEIVRRNAPGAFGRDHHFDEIQSPEDFRKRVPIRDYDGHEPYIARVRNGETEALFGPDTDVLMFATTSGTTDKIKTIPVTRESLNNYRDGWSIWGVFAFYAHYEILRRGLKPILQMASDWRDSYTPAGIPCGAMSGLTAHMLNPMVRIVYCMPPATMRIKDIESKYYMALRLSVWRDVGATVAANPSTMIATARHGDKHKEMLIRDVADGTIDPRWEIDADVKRAVRLRCIRKRKDAAKRLEQIVERTGRLLPKDYWPGLNFLANWTGGTMGEYLRQLPEYFGDRPVRDVGLIASEGRMTIPIADNTPAGLLDIRHHYFEFIPEDQAECDQPETVEGADLVEGRRYFILMTTAGGLYRYHIHDLVRCVGFQGETPLIEFLNKGSHYSSLSGEKLSEFQVVAAVEDAKRALGQDLSAYLLLPTWGDPPYYSLLVEESDVRNAASAERFEIEVEERLKKINFEYENKRDTLRLDPIRIRLLPTGSWDDFQKQRLAQTGGTLEQYKKPCLLPDLKAIERFANLRGGSQSGDRFNPDRSY